MWKTEADLNQNKEKKSVKTILNPHCITVATHVTFIMTPNWPIFFYLKENITVKNIHFWPFIVLNNQNSIKSHAQSHQPGSQPRCLLCITVNKRHSWRSRLSIKHNELSDPGSATATESAFITSVTNMCWQDVATMWLRSNRKLWALQPQTADCLLSHA